MFLGQMGFLSGSSFIFLLKSVFGECQGIRGVLVRLTTCKRLTNSLPKLSLVTLSPPETAGQQVGRIYGGPLSISKPFHFLGIP